MFGLGGVQFFGVFTMRDFTVNQCIVWKLSESEKKITNISNRKKNLKIKKEKF